MRILNRDLAFLQLEKETLLKQATPNRWSRFAPKAREHEVQ